SQRMPADLAVDRTVGGSRTWLCAHQLVARLTLRTDEFFGTTFGHDTAPPRTHSLSRRRPSSPHVNDPCMTIVFDSLDHSHHCRAKSVRFGPFADWRSPPRREARRPERRLGLVEAIGRSGRVTGERPAYPARKRTCAPSAATLSRRCQ